MGIERMKRGNMDTTQRPITGRQFEVLQFIVAHIKEHLCSPTVREICGHLGFVSTNAASDHLKALKIKGYLAGYGNGRSRGYTVHKSKRAEFGLVFAEAPKETRADHSDWCDDCRARGCMGCVSDVLNGGSLQPDKWRKAE
jgi:SOS-response transcriptional repressor LexA